MLIDRHWWAILALCLWQAGCSRDTLNGLVARLSDPDVAIRRAAARTLVERPIVDERAVAALAKSAADTDIEVRLLSIQALGKLGPASRSSVPALKSALADSEKRVRLDAALALQKIDPRDESASSVLVDAMREGDGRTLLAVGAMGPDAAWAVPTLIGLLSHSSPQVRALAAKTLGRIGPSAIAAKAALETAHRDSNSAVQKASKEAVTRLQNPSATAR